jgi:N-acetylglucosaminyldiphosphoundecaprenol N-acetyl-beta-D-mannosaminyltransferase
MNLFFGVHIEFDHEKLVEKILDVAANGKGYCCFIDNTLLAKSYSNDDDNLRRVLNEATLNSCDGSYIALMASILYKEKYHAFNGPELFKQLIHENVKHYIVGNTNDVFDKICSKLNAQGYSTENLRFLSLPFESVESFNYHAISEKINMFSPDLIWVSLGAPKQERFMNMLLPHIHRGMMMGVGAALNYFSGTINDIPNWATKWHLIWLYRIFTEPKKQIPRCIMILRRLPLIFLKEWIKIKEERHEKYKK